jgi:hypothetical protein
MPLRQRSDPLASPHARQQVWAIIGASCMEDGRLEWARQALAWADDPDPPRSWPANHPANAENTLPWPQPQWYEKLIGKAVLKWATWRGRK